MEGKKRTVKNVIEYVEAQLSLEEGLDLETIAKRAGYSRFHLNRMFCEVTGSTLHRYIKERRLSEAAKKLVMEEEKTIADIALEAAYQSQQASLWPLKRNTDVRQRRTEKKESARNLERWRSFPDKQEPGGVQHEFCTLCH